MVNAVIKASKAGRKARKRLSAFSAVISRTVGEDTFESDPVKVTFGETTIEEIISNEVLISVRLRDIIIDVCDYVIPGISEDPIKPGEDDRFTIDLGSGSTVFEAISRVEGRFYRRSDRYGNTWRIHTKEISNAEGV